MIATNKCLNHLRASRSPAAPLPQVPLPEPSRSSTITDHLPPGGRDRAPLPGSAREQQITARFADAFEQGDVQAIVAFGRYIRDPHAAVAHAHGLIVLTLAGDHISTVTGFTDNSILPRFGLPRILRD